METLTDYDGNAPNYDELLESSYFMAERQEVIRRLEAMCSDGIRVLELGCGTGLCTTDLVSCSIVSSILAVDISSQSLSLAVQKVDMMQDATLAQKVQFVCADCREPQIFGSGNFDLVFVSGFLECANDRQALEQMWQVIGMNLRPGGLFFGQVYPPTEDPRTMMSGWSSGAILELGNRYEILEDTEDGIIFNVIVKESRKLKTSFFKKSVMEESARKAGMTGVPDWQPIFHKEGEPDSLPAEPLVTYDWDAVLLFIRK